jgi:hypothetical protein
MKKNNAFRRAAALIAALSITVSLAAPAFADTYYIDYGDITITKNEDGSQTIEQGGDKWTDKAGEETVITTSNTVITTLESDLEGPAAEDSDFGPVVEDNYQSAQPEDAEESEDADQPEIAEEPKSADRQESADQQAAPAAAPADTTPVNPKDDGFWGNTITVINNIADKVLNLTLKDVKIDVSDTGDQYDWDQKGKAALSVQGKGNVEIELDGDNELKSGTQSAGLEKNSTGKLTLKDDNNEAGSLTATGGFNSAGIGGGYLGDGKNITITGGTVTATGGSSGAGIGGGREGKGENITITGGTVNATGNEDGAGIGGGSSGSGENITINGGEVTASGGDNWDDCGAGIGGGNGGVGKNITITGGTVNATGGYGGGAAGIGGAFANGENITITGGTVNAAGSYFDHGMGAGIGGGGNSSGNNITITGGTVNVTGGYGGGAGIGGGAEGGGGNNITIKGGTVTATGGGYRGNSGAGIGGGSSGSGENITINDGKVTATGGSYAAGIGGGSVGAWGGDAGSGKNITINGGTVNATGTDGGAGIGGGENGNGEDITINGGKVNASGAYGGAGIGGGVNGIGSKVTVSGAAQVTATATGSGPDWSGVGTGATIGNGGSKTPDGPVDGKEIQADISHLTTGYIHHIIYNPDLDLDGKPDGILKEWWEFALPKPIPDGESLDLHVETLKGAPLLFNTRQQGSTLRVTTDNLSARLHGTRQALETLQEQGVEQIQFVTTLKTTTLSVADLLAEGGSWFALEHDGLGSRRLSAAQAESLKCRMR